MIYCGAMYRLGKKNRPSNLFSRQTRNLSEPCSFSSTPHDSSMMKWFSTTTLNREPELLKIERIDSHQLAATQHLHHPYASKTLKPTSKRSKNPAEPPGQILNPRAFCSLHSSRRAQLAPTGSGSSTCLVKQSVALWAVPRCRDRQIFVLPMRMTKKPTLVH